MNHQMRKRSSVVYFLALIVTAVMLMTAVAETPSIGGRTYTTDADFDEGVLVGVEHESVHDQLQLSEEHVTLPFIWIPNMQGTVSKVNTETGDELGRYRVVPPGLPVENGSPSRTTVDLEGNCWVGNRAAGTVVKIGLYEAGNWIDRNSDGICQTSQDTNGDGDITGDELLPWGEDECVLYEVVLIPGKEGTYVPGTFHRDLALAWNPNPKDGGSGAVTDEKLSWLPGDTATSHDVYFGTTNPPPLVSNNQTGTAYDPGPLQPGTTYYWQINEVEADGTTIHIGNVWSFTTYAGPFVHRAAYWDVRYPTAWTSGTSLRDGFEAAGYDILNADQLKAWMDARIVDGMPSVVVFCKDIAPDTVAEWRSSTCTLRKYLEAGGKIVWYADIPMYYQGHSNGTRTTWGVSGSFYILGFNAASGLWDIGDEVVFTPDGIDWGLTETWQSFRSTSTIGLRVLAEDASGYAAAWVKHYVPGDTYRGFVRLFDRSDQPNFDDVRRLAEYFDPSPEASNPNPRDGAVDVSTETNLSWIAGAGALSRDVYFGTVSPPPLVNSNQTETSYDPGSLGVATTYYWQIVEQPGGHAGPVWSFTTIASAPGQASDPSPPDAAKVSIKTYLSWTAGTGATSHDVYFGTTSPGTFRGNQVGTIFDLGTMANNTTYYWRIDEKNAVGTTTGTVWSFKTFREGTGTILREVWEGIGGVLVLDLTSDIDYPDNPSFNDELPSFEAPINWADNYGTRIHGYLHPETTGLYTFWIASDDASELWLSTDDDPANAVLRANVPGWTPSRIWDKYPAEQQSDPISLTGGNKYYIMALYKEGGGGDNLAVAWRGPDQPLPPVNGSGDAVIAGAYLSPYAPATDVYDISLYDTDKWSTSPRGLAIDAQNNLWAGTWISSDTGSSKYYYIDGATGTILKTVDTSAVGHNAYGAVIDKYGILWSSGQANYHVLRLDPSTDPPTISTLNLEQFSYGIGLDYEDHVFVSGWQDYSLSRVDIKTGTKEWSTWGPYEARGVACTSDNDVWVASTAWDRVDRFDNNGNLKTSINVGDGPTGVAVDAEGKVWACNLNDTTIVRINPATNTVDLTKSIIKSGGHYSYSDMTGILARTITTRIGTWTVIYDAGEDTPWGVVSWNSDEPVGTSITVKVRSSNDLVNWSAWETATNGVDLQDTPCARYLQIETTLQIVDGDVSPILYDLTVLPSYAAVTYDGDTLVSTGGEPTATAQLIATLRDEGGEIYPISGKEVTFTLSAEGKDDIVVGPVESVDGVVTVDSPPLEPDVYAVNVTVECASGSGILAVYNPEGGFATGGGWIVPADDGLNTHPLERANFGFNAKYKQDAATGHLEFRYSDGYIDLKSSSIEQLVITGGKIAQFKGWASVNKEEGHWFFVKAIDEGQPGVNDTFDIKVWAPLADIEGDPTERAGGILQGGNIVVHTK